MLKAATLIESLTSLIIIAICLGIASMIYMNVIRSTNNQEQLSAHILLQETALNIKEKNNYLDEQIQSEFFIINKSLSKYDNTENLYLLTLKALNKEEKVVATHKELIVVTE